MSTELRRQLDKGDIDIALVKRETGSGECRPCRLRNWR